MLQAGGGIIVPALGKERIDGRFVDHCRLDTIYILLARKPPHAILVGCLRVSDSDADCPYFIGFRG